MKKATLKSKKYYKLCTAALVVASVSAAVAIAGFGGLMISPAVLGDKIGGFREDIISTPQYNEYVENKTDEYTEMLYLKEITKDEYLAKVNNLSDIEPYLKANDMTEELQMYRALNKEYDTCFYTFTGLFGTGLVTFLASVVTGNLLMGKSVAEEEKEKLNKDEESEME